MASRRTNPIFREKYATARGRFDLYIPFVERAFTLLKPGGLFGFICPTNFMKREHGQELRDLLRQQTSTSPSLTSRTNRHSKVL